MKAGFKSILWSAAALLLLLSIAVPLLNAVTAFVMMVPIVILYTTLSKRAFMLHMLVVYGIATAVLGPPGPYYRTILLSTVGRNGAFIPQTDVST